MPISQMEAVISVPIPFGQSGNPEGVELLVDSVGITLGGTRWLPTSGEYHFARNSASVWRDELLKMKAGGIDIVSTYVFWIHHEEVEGRWIWSGQRNLREFVQLCKDAGLHVALRLGPWAHGECRNGGFPDWVAHGPYELRSSDPAFLAKVAILYQSIFAQVSGLMWKDGGPIIGVQIENEYSGSPGYMVTLKEIAVNSGFDVPLYTRTGWTNTKPALPYGVLLPMFGDYPDGFWDRSIHQASEYRKAYLLSPHRAETGLGAQTTGAAGYDAQSSIAYPYLCCEIGGGMASSYHRRLHIEPKDIASLALCKLATGDNLQGFYMYHGGTNPEGALTTLNETQATGYYNDLPVKTYDFQAPLGEFGQVRAHYHRLRLLSLFQRHFGTVLVDMPAVFPSVAPSGIDDIETVRWAARTDGHSGFLFVNNYQRFVPMPAKTNVQFALPLRTETLLIPSEPIDISADVSLVWPFSIDLSGIHLVYATAQPIAEIDHAGTHTWFFFQTGEVPVEFVFRGAQVEGGKGVSVFKAADGTVRASNLTPMLEPAIRVQSPGGRSVQIVLLSEEEALTFYVGEFGGLDRAFLTKSNLVVDGDRLRLSSTDRQNFEVAVFPALAGANFAVHKAKRAPKGIFSHYALQPAEKLEPVVVKFDQVQLAGPAREVPMGQAGVAAQPTDGDFDNAATWKIRLPSISGGCNLLLRIHYAGDVARLYSGDILLVDNFCNGDPFEVGLSQFSDLLAGNELLLKILPLRKDAPIYLQQANLVDFGAADSIAELSAIDVIETFESSLG